MIGAHRIAKNLKKYVSNWQTCDLCHGSLKGGNDCFQGKNLFGLKAKILKFSTNRSFKVAIEQYSCQILSHCINPVQRISNLKFITQPVLKLNNHRLLRDLAPGTQFYQILLIFSLQLAKCSNHTKFQVFWLSQS